MSASLLRNLLLVHCMAAMLVIRHLPPVASQEFEDEKEFDYIQGSEKGPEKWGKLKPEWEICSVGEMQSPIDLSSEKVQAQPLSGRLNSSDKLQPCKSNHQEQRPRHHAKVGGGLRFALHQWNRVPVEATALAFTLEHSFNGCRYPLEVHMVHESLDKKIVVVGITYKIGRPDTFLSKLLPEIKVVTEQKDAEVGAGVVDPRRLIKLHGRKFYRNVGSLTTPPCTEGVIWNMVKKVKKASTLQIKTLRDAVHDGHETNARPIQEINNRQVHLYTPKVLAGHA